jgi:DnaK suppressor protein
MLSKTFLKKIKERLLNERHELSEKSVRRPDIDTDGDETDEIQGNMLIELHNQLNTRNHVKLKQIADALQRVDDKSYGVCQDCEEDIPEKRLLINPYFLTCISCAEEREAEDKQRKRA